MTAGVQSARVEDNEQLSEGHPVAKELGDTVITALQGDRLFVSSRCRCASSRHALSRIAGGVTTAADAAEDPSVVPLTSVYHNPLRRWAEMQAESGD